MKSAIGSSRAEGDKAGNGAFPALGRGPIFIIAVMVVLLSLTVGVVLVGGNNESGSQSAPANVRTAANQPSPIDIGFAQDMLVHHQQAVTMTQMVDGRVSSQVDGIAEVIESNQLIEIGQLQGSLDLWGESRFAAGEPMTWMHRTNRGHVGGHSGPMLGMATQTELNSLQQPPGPQLDRRFLRLMLRHHRGGVVMASHAAEHASLDPIKNLARRMVYDQTVESLRISTILDNDAS